MERRNFFLVTILAIRDSHGAAGGGFDCPLINEDGWFCWLVYDKMSSSDILPHASTVTEKLL